jgi:2,3-bisphosphoglycerate-independent phosphoglycerate mutase
MECMKDTHHTPAALVILDGWGMREDAPDNAIARTHTPHFDHLWQHFPHTTLAASGEAVGLPNGQMGNSEVGHMVIGSGMPLPTDLVRISRAVENGELAQNPVLRELIASVTKGDGTLHLCGLYSAGGVHSHQDHIRGIARIARECGVKNIALHIFLDGRDTPPQSAVEYVRGLEKELSDMPDTRIASVSGRYFAMDRDNNAERTDNAFSAVAQAEGRAISGSVAEYIAGAYETGEFDEFFVPSVVAGGAPILAGDAVLHCNFRADRARQLSRSMKEHCAVHAVPFATLTEYDETLAVPVLFPPIRPTHTIARAVSEAGLSQAHIAETEKYPHVTYYLNGGKETPHTGEEYILVPSRKDVKTHDEAPEMRAKEVAEKAVQALENGTDVLCINIANADMVGHTAVPEAIARAIVAVDSALGVLYEEVVKKRGGVLLVTADHGNAEQHSDSEGKPHTAHTTNPVPCIVAGAGTLTLRDGGSLADIAPTFLSLIGVAVPEVMEGTPLQHRIV